MDLLHQLVVQLDVSSRCKLYQKLAMCNLAAPVCLMTKNLIYMNTSLHQIKISRIFGCNRKEGNVTIAPIPVVSMTRIGKMSQSFISKSKFGNDLLNFKVDAKTGSCGFFTRDSGASNNRRKLAEGNIDGIWYQNSDKLGTFACSFTLLNLSGNSQDHVDTSLILASATDLLILFCDEDMFKDDRYIEYLDYLKQKTKDTNGESFVKEIIVIFTKACLQNVNQCHSKFIEMCSKVTYHLFKGNENYQKILQTVQSNIKISFRSNTGDTGRTLNERLGYDLTCEVESSGNTMEKVVDVSSSFIKQMELLIQASKIPETRSKINMKLFPLQSFTKKYAKIVREECRCLDIARM